MSYNWSYNWRPCDAQDFLWHMPSQKETLISGHVRSQGVGETR